MNCELCNFKTPRVACTAIILYDNDILVLKRNQEPFKGQWDLPGGYMSENETPEMTMRRELKEELNINECSMLQIGAYPGHASYKGVDFTVLNIAFLVNVSGEQLLALTLDEENSAYEFKSLLRIEPYDVAFDSNQDIIKDIKKRFVIDMEYTKLLLKQLDPTCEFNEQNYYEAVLNGHVAKRYEGERLIGMGWIFPRSTVQHKQAVVEDMIVDMESRGQGIGKEILMELLEWAKEKNMDMVELTTNPKRVAANGLYKTMGFQLHPTNHYLYKV